MRSEVALNLGIEKLDMLSMGEVNTDKSLLEMFQVRNIANVGNF